MSIENCDKCAAYGFVCKRANFIERMTGREKIVVLNDTGQKFAHTFPIETCEVVTGEVKAKKYAKTLLKYLGHKRIVESIREASDRGN
ncbi:MAG: hypothetical protein Q8Q30_01360 [Candidatus Woesebacteria bacterium]|nr:hypothetical protein [Candidatus Woesebacteria bacterium]